MPVLAASAALSRACAEALTLVPLHWCQVTVEYKKDGGAVVPLRVHTILISTQHNPDVSNEKASERRAQPDCAAAHEELA